MPNIKSVKKDVLRSRANNLRNVTAKSAVKTLIKKAKAAALNGGETLAKAVRLVQKATDKTVQRGIIHKNKAARLKSRLAKAVAKAQAK